MNTAADLIAAESEIHFLLRQISPEPPPANCPFSAHLATLVDRPIAESIYAKIKVRIAAA